MKNSFPREIRLVTEEQFKKVFNKTQRKFSTEVFTVYFCYNSFTYPRLGIIVPKRNVNRATKRNYLKRIIREHFRLNQHKFKNIDIVFFVNKIGKELTKKELNSRLEQQLSKLRI